MSINIDNTLAFQNVQNNSGIGEQKKIHLNKGQHKTNPIRPDAFQKTPIVIPQYSQMEKLYQKFLETVSPSVLLDSYLNEQAISRMIANNPNVKDILSKHSMPVEISPENVANIKKVHLDTTESYARGIAEQMGLSAQETDIISKGALFHDFGKTLIPTSLLNKTGKLTPEEKRIVDLHSRLGYEMLKTTSLNPKILQIVKDHHTPLNKNPDINTQVVSVADIYSALRTPRSYKQRLSQDQSLTILNKYAEMGHVDPQIIKALKEHIKQPDLLVV